MVHAGMAMGILSITIEMKTSFRKPVFVGEEITFEGEVKKVGSRIVEMESFALGPEGKIRVEASGRFFIKSTDFVLNGVSQAR